MKTETLLAILFAGLLAGGKIAYGGTITFYDNLNNFLDATQSLDLLVEDFEGGFELTNSEHWSACLEPLNSRSDDACFPAGGLLPGFSITSQTNIGGVLRMAPDVWDAGSHVVGAWPFQINPSSFNPTVVTFDDGPTAVGADVYGVRLAPGVPTGEPEPVLVQIFDRDDVLLDEILVEPPAYNQPAFAGVVSTVPLGRVVYGTQLDGTEEVGGEMIDNLYFGGGPGRLAAEATEFGPQSVGGAANMVVALTNEGGLDLTVGSIPSPTAPFFVTADSCSGQMLTPGDDCTLELGFQPVYVQAFSDTLEIPVDEPSAPLLLALRGHGVRPRVDVAPVRLDFGTVTVGDVSASQTVAVANPTAAAVQLTSITAVDGVFEVTGGSCGAVPVALPAGASCTLEIVFNPAHAGQLGGAVVLIAGDQAASASIALAGEGVQL